jgi:isoleucyl-tRNA synthetase
VHLADWPSVDEFPADPDLVAAMDQVREIASTGLAVRKTHKIRVRQPLSTITVVSHNPARLAPFVALLADELNVKKVDVLDRAQIDPSAYGMVLSLTLNARALGPRVGKEVQRLIAAAKAGEWTSKQQLPGNASVVVAGTELLDGEFELSYSASEPRNALGFLADGGFVALSTEITPELAAEGLARDVIRAVQQARKDADLDVSDRIVLTLTGDDAAVAAIETHRDLIAGEVLATMLATLTGAPTARENGAVPVGEGSAVTISLERA